MTYIPRFNPHAKTLREYLYTRRSIDAATQCWEFILSLDRDGYGRTVSRWYEIYGKSGIHQLSYIEHVGQIPDGLFVCHTCDNRKCFNPDHLWLGTNQDNTADKVAKGRGRNGGQHVNLARGSRHADAKLSEQDIPAIGSALSRGTSVRSLADQYGVSPGAIHFVKIGKTWRHVP